MCLCSAPVLMHYNTQLPVKVACGTSPFEISAVLSHLTQNGGEHPLAFASTTLSPAERNYAQFEREALSVVLAVKQFHNYGFGRKFTILQTTSLCWGVLTCKSNFPDCIQLNDQIVPVTSGIYLRFTTQVRYVSSKCRCLK